MDRSVDSIGSCSLDVDADSSDISDASGSLNFPTPISVKDITREFTTNIRERCSVRTVQHNSETYVNPESGEVCTVLTQPVGGISKQNIVFPASNCGSNTDKKPSYLNLACCVNGYSNLTTYDSKIRQNINKSRDVSPIRPSSSSIQYCKKNNSLAPPVLLTMPTKSNDKSSTSNGKKYTTDCEANSNSRSNNNENGDNIFLDIQPELLLEKQSSTSFIQQRVERLYGPGALAQGFYSPKKVRGDNSLRVDNPTTTELSRKFQQISPCKDYSEFQKKISLSAPNSSRHIALPTVVEPVRSDVDLPVLRHLSREFRAQLPKISPKKNYVRSTLIEKEYSENNMNGNSIIPEKSPELPAVNDEVDHKIVATVANVEYISEKHTSTGDSGYNNIKNIQPNTILSQTNNNSPISSNVSSINHETSLPEEDGRYFLSLLKAEQTRLLDLAAVAEAHTVTLTNNAEVGEDILGLLRSASGRARLLVSQKMKQFEGLCHKNLNHSPADKFPTTVDDLQGFWDMVNLQVDHINLIFEEVDALKNNDWKKPEQVSPIIKTSRQHKSTNSGQSKSKTDTNSGNDSKNTTAKSNAALKRESQRKQLQEIKRKNKLALAAKLANTADCEASSLSPNSIAIFVNENCNSTSN